MARGNRNGRSGSQEKDIDMTKVRTAISTLNKKFKKGEDRELFVTSVQIAAGHLKDQEQIKVFFFSLSDDLANACLKKIEHWKDLDDAATWLKTHLEGDKHPTNIMFRIINETQKEKEKVLEYVERIERLFTKGYPKIDELTKVDLIWMGLRSDIVKEFKGGFRPNTVKELKEVAIEVELRNIQVRRNEPEKESKGLGQDISSSNNAQANNENKTVTTASVQQPVQSSAIVPQPLQPIMIPWSPHIPPPITTTPDNTLQPMSRGTKRFKSDRSQRNYERSPYMTPKWQNHENPRSVQPHSYMNHGQCFSCGEMGHYRTNCPRIRNNKGNAKN